MRTREVGIQEIHHKVILVALTGLENSWSVLWSRSILYRLRLNLQSNSTVAVGFKLVQQICNNTPASSLETVESRMN